MTETAKTITPEQQNHFTKPVLLHIGIVLVAMCFLGSVFPMLFNSTYRGSPDIHATIEMVGALIGVLAGIVLVVHFYVLGNRFWHPSFGPKSSLHFSQA
jgi:hypothetical protein